MCIFDRDRETSSDFSSNALSVRPSLILFLTEVVVYLAMMVTLTSTGTHAESTADHPEIATSSVFGHVYVSTPTGASDIIRGIELGLLERTGLLDSALAQTQAIFDSANVAKSRSFEKAAAELNALMSKSPSKQSIETLAQLSGLVVKTECIITQLIDTFFAHLSAAQLKSVRSSFEGSYEFDSLKPGRYLLCSRLKSELRDIHWIVPVEVTSIEPLEQDLADFNMQLTSTLSDISALQQLNEQILRMVRIIQPEFEVHFHRAARELCERSRTEPLPYTLPSLVN